MPQHDSNNPPFVILASGAFARDQLEIVYESTPRATTPELERSIASIWNDQFVRAKTDGRLLFNGEMLRYLGHEVRGADSVGDDVPPPQDPNTKIQIEDPGRNPKFVLQVGPTNYRDFLGTNLYNAHRVQEIGWENFSNPIGTTGTILTADHRICYGRRSHRVAWHANHVHTFGGALEAADRAADGSVDAFASLMRELHEELGLQTADIREMVCVGLIRDKEIHQPELLFDVRVNLTAAEIEQRWQSAECRDEHDAIVSLPDNPEAIAPFIAGCGPIAPVAVGALHLHARVTRPEAGEGL